MEPILLTMLYREFSNGQASVVIRGHNAPKITLTTIHESIDSTVYAQDSSGDKDSRPYTVRDNESVTVLARRDGDIVASAVFQVETQGIEEAGYVLRPVSLCNILVDQCDATLVTRAAERGLAAIDGTLLLADIDRVLEEVEQR